YALDEQLLAALSPFDQSAVVAAEQSFSVAVGKKRLNKRQQRRYGQLLKALRGGEVLPEPTVEKPALTLGQSKRVQSKPSEAGRDWSDASFGPEGQGSRQKVAAFDKMVALETSAAQEPTHEEQAPEAPAQASKPKKEKQRVASANKEVASRPVEETKDPQAAPVAPAPAMTKAQQEILWIDDLAKLLEISSKDARKISTTTSRERFTEILERTEAACGYNPEYAKRFLASNSDLFKMEDKELQAFLGRVSATQEIWAKADTESESHWRSLAMPRTFESYVQGLEKVQKKHEQLETHLLNMEDIGLNGHAVFLIIGKAFRASGGAFYANGYGITRQGLESKSLKKAIKNFGNVRRSIIDPTFKTLVGCGVLAENHGALSIQTGISADPGSKLEKLVKFVSWLMDEENAEFCLNHDLC
ncbi:MAG: hypothetical protein KDD62_15665, partial [Bdellovibrionales bacterium]|nr:hypothetical protein [Bdellovibrionales bacterium]